MKRKNILLILMLALMVPASAWAQYISPMQYSQGVEEYTFTVGFDENDESGTPRAITGGNWGGSSDYSGTTSSAQGSPYGRYYGWEYKVFLYRASYIDFSGTITKITYYPQTDKSAGTNTTSSVTINGVSDSNPFQIWMKEVADDYSDLAQGTSFSTYASGATKVFSGYIPATTSGSANTITLTNSFTLSQNKSLLILVRSVVTGTGDGACNVLYKSPSNAPNVLWEQQQDSNDPGANCTADRVSTTLLPCITFTYTIPYTVTYNANGGSGTMTDPNSPYASGSTVTVMSNAFTAPSGMTFSGWNTAADGSGTSYAAGDHFTISANITLYAQWAASANCEAIGENSTDYGSSYSSGGYTPIDLYYKYSYEQMVYDGSSMPTTINSISFKYKSTYAVTQKTDVDIYLGETTSTTLTSYMSASDLTKVYSGAMDFPANSDGWVEFTFNENGGSFSHDQSKNIVVVVNDKSGAYPSNYSSMYFYYLTGSNGVHRYSRNDSSGAYSVPPSSGTASTYLPVVRFCGSSVVTIPTHTITATADPTAGGTVSFMTGPANSTTARTHLPLDSYRNYSFSQQIYTPDEVGGGTISSISLYSVDGNLNDGVDFTRTLAVYMAHTDKTEFSSTSDWISNSDSPDMALVYSGNVTFDCGEWNTINFTNSFNYDGTRNLVLIIADNTGTSAPAGNYLECKTFTPSSGGYCSLNHDTQFNPSSPSGNGERLTEKNQILINPGSSDSRDFPEGASCTLVATPNPNYQFDHWTDNSSNAGSNETYTISNITTDHTVVAHFTIDTHTLYASVSPSGAGTISANGTTISGSTTYNHGTSVTLTVNAASGYTFSNWTIDGSPVNSNSTTITMDTDHTVVANFTQDTYTISVSANPSNYGSVSGGGNSFHYNDPCTVTAQPANDNYGFLNWTENGTVVSNNASYNFNVTGNRTLVANFVQLYTLTFDDNPTGGTVVVTQGGTPVTSGQRFPAGTTFSVTATAAAGYHFTGWTVEGTDASVNNPSNSTATLTMGSTNTTLTASFGDCTITTFPWHEDFENYTVNTVPECWDNSASTSTTLSGNPHYIWGVYSYNENKMIRMYNYLVRSGTALINTPPITLPANGVPELVFDYSHLASCGDFYVKISQDGGLTFTNLWSHGANSTSYNYNNPGTFNTIDPIDLSAYAGKTVIIQFYAEANYGSGAIFVDNITIGACDAPSNLTVDNETPDGAVISWDGTDDSYIVEYAVPTITYTYETETVEILNEGFEGNLSGWTYTASSNNWDEGWTIGQSGDPYSNGINEPHSGSYNLLVSGSSGSGIYSYLITPSMDLSGYSNVKFSCYYGNKASGSSIDIFGVYYRTSSNGTWTQLFYTTSGHSEWTSTGEQSLPSASYLELGFYYKDNDGFSIVVDDILITGEQQVATEHLSYDSWTTASNSATSPYSFTGLTLGTTYQARVKDACGHVSNVVSFTPACNAPTNLTVTPSSNTAQVTWLGNESSYNVRYVEVLIEEGFENGIPNTWTTIDSDGDGNNWLALDEIQNVYTSYSSSFSDWAHGGSNAAASPSYANGVGSMNSNQWLISPQINLGGTLRFYAHSTDSSDKDAFEVLLSTSGNSVSNFTTTLRSMQNASYNNWDEVEIDLSSYSGQGYIAIHHVSSGMYFLVIDDFTVTGPWQTSSSNATSPYTLTGLTANTDYIVQVQSACGGDWTTTTFTTLNGHTITAVADPAGSGTFAFTGEDVISSTATTAQVSPDGNVTVTATATAGYTFMNWIEGGSVVSTTNAYALTGVNASHDLIAHFVDMTASNTWPAAVTTLAAATPGYSVDGSTITISNANGLAWLISTVNGLNSQSGNDITSSTVINLTADVDMSAHIWVPIGTTEHPFVGTFNGNGHTISGVTRALEFPNQGVFGYVSGGTIHDVVVNTNITGDCNYMGSVAGTLASGTVYNTGSTGTVTANANTIAVGGTVGYNGGLVHSSFATGTFTGLAGDYVGGLVGENAPAGRLYNSYSNTTVNTGNGAGLVGYNAGTVANCYTNGVPNMGVAYIHTNKASGVVEYVYGDKTPFYYLTMETGHTLRYHGSSFSAVQSDIKHLDYMYRDNAITLAGGQTSSYVPSSVSYDNNHTVKWNGLVSALNQWVADNKTSGVAIGTLSSWYRPLTTAINGDLPVLGFGGETTLGAANGSPKTLKYGTMDDLLTTFNNSTASIFHYGKATGVTHVPTANVNVFINEDAVLLQATSPDPGAFINTTVGVTFDNSDHGTHAYDYWGNKLDYDWHFLSTPLSDAKIGATYNDYVAHGYGSDIDIKTLVNSYFPNNLPMTLHDANWRWDFYTYYEPEYHWINLKRNKNNHYHVDGGWSISYNYIADDQAVGDAASLACVFIPGKGYMMAISKDVFMNSTGTLNRGNVPIRLTLKEPGDINYASGWNLVGNPYQAYLNINALNRNLYIYDADQGVYAPYAPAASDNPATPSQYIHPHQAFFVHAASDGEELIFTPSMASTETTPYSYYRDDRIDYPLVNLYVENNAGQRDLTVVEFHRPELGGAQKLETMRNAPFTLAAHYAGISYGILFATDDIERIPVRFKTDENGWVTLTWNTHNGEFSKLLLIDNKLGVEHNMLADNSYTFEASPDDYSSRFYIVYDCSGMGVEENEESGASTGSATAGTFAYINNGNIVIDIGSGHGASIQVIDVLGRVLYSKTIAGTDGTCTVSTKGLAKGVYLIRLADGHNVKTQKLVVQ